MEARRTILCCVASASVSALLAATATAAAIRVEVGQRSVPPAPGSAAVQQEAEKYAYILGEYGGRLAVYRAGEQEPATVLDVYLGLLPPADAQALRQGIPMEDRAELERRLEEFIS